MELGEAGDATVPKVGSFRAFPTGHTEAPRQLPCHMFAFAALSQEKQRTSECLHFTQRKLNFCPEDALPIVW